MKQGVDIVAYLVDKGNPDFVGDYTGLEDPWPQLIAQLAETEPLLRAEAMETFLNGLDGQADELRTRIYEALGKRFQRKRSADGLQDVPPALMDKKEQAEGAVVSKGVATEEDGDADLLAFLYQGQIAYDHTEAKWFLWGGQYWIEDRINAVINIIKSEVAGQYVRAAAECITAGNDKIAEKYSKRAERLHTRRRKEHVLWAAASLPELALSGEEWDANPWLLGTGNGVIDLQTGKLRSGQPRDYIRTVIPTSFEGLDVPAPRWETFVSEIFDHDQQIVGFVHRLLGYGITGLNTEHAFPVLWGPQGRNGKTTLLETLSAVLGPDVTMSIPADEIMHSYKPGAGGPQPYIWKLRGKRIVWSSETNPDRRLDSETVKKLTGGDRIHVHAKYRDPIEFTPTHLLLLLTNHRPKIEAADNAIWDRVHLLPFRLRFVDDPQAENERQRDAYLLNKLREEREGILAWLVRGCLAWQDRGSLDPPPQVKLATAEYRGEEDTISQFVDEFAVTGDGLMVTHRDLYKEYVRWCKDFRLWPSGSRDFGAKLKEQFQSKHTNKGMTYYGIGLPVSAMGRQISFDDDQE